jgi:hypothetical protein
MTLARNSQRTNAASKGGLVQMEPPCAVPDPLCAVCGKLILRAKGATDTTRS